MEEHDYLDTMDDMEQTEGMQSAAEEEDLVAENLDSLLGVGVVDQDTLERGIIAKVIHFAHIPSGVISVIVILIY